jgi:GAF domain-containing protein
VSLLLNEARRILDAVGIILWAWDPAANGLTPVLADGYSDRVLAQLPLVRRDADNATAAAYRSAQTCAVAGGSRATSALAVPVLVPGGCAGVLAVELRNGAEQTGSTRAVVTMIAAQMGRLVEPARVSSAGRYERSGRRPASEASACA